MNKKGFTLVEIVMAITIAGIIVSIFAVVINSGMGVWFLIKGQRSIMMETRGVMKRMVREIRINKDARIYYQQDGMDLKRNGLVLLENLASPGGLEFVYLDASGEVTAIDEDIRTIRITIIVEEGDNRVRLRGAASIRNR